VVRPKGNRTVRTPKHLQHLRQHLPTDRRRRTKVIIALVVLLFVVHAVVGLVVWKARSAEGGSAVAEGDAAPRGPVTLPDGCAVLPPEVAATLVPGATKGQERINQDAGWGVVRECAWESWDPNTMLDHHLQIKATAFLNPARDSPVPSPGAATESMRGPGLEEPRSVTVGGADEALLGQPETIGQRVIQKLRARYENVVVEVSYDPGDVTDPAKLAQLATTGAEGVLTSLRTA
jgi:hypothetical protein